VTIFDREKAIKFGWRQCSIFNRSSSPLLVKQLPDTHQIENAFYLVLSHPCSLLNANLDSEPNLEYIVCQPIDKVKALAV
jgi:hypothetical protein